MSPLCPVVDDVAERVKSLGTADPPPIAMDGAASTTEESAKSKSALKPSSFWRSSSSSSMTSSTVASTAASSSRNYVDNYNGDHTVTVITPKLLQKSMKANKKQFRLTMEKALLGGGDGNNRSSRSKKTAAAAAAVASIRKAGGVATTVEVTPDSSNSHPPSRRRSPPKVKFLDEEVTPAVTSSSQVPESEHPKDDDAPVLRGGEIHARIDGPLVMIGFGSIGRGMLPLIERHIRYPKDEFSVIEPTDDYAHILEERGVRHVKMPLTVENYESTLRGLFSPGRGGGRGGMIVNLSVDVDSVAIMVLAQELGVPYIDTVIEPWPGVYFNSSLGNADRTNYALRERMRDVGRKYAGGTGSTAVSSCGANPGMVSWLMKEALLRLAEDTGVDVSRNPTTKEDWARLAMTLGVKGVHVAERDTQVSSTPKSPGVFVNTWSVDGFLSEGYQPAELGWGTHERRMPPGGRRHDIGNGHGIWIDRPGGDTRVRSWVPTGPQLGLLVTHNEALSIADYYTVWDGDDVAYRPTCHYAYHPCNDAILSLHETNGAGRLPKEKHVLAADEIVSGNDDLGVLLYGHAKGAMWYGSRLSIDEARKLAPYQNATGMQVTSAVLAGMVWALENPNAGFVEADEMDHVRCLQIQRPYLGSVECHYTDWTPIRDRINAFGEDHDDEDPWQFTNFLAL
ncbi:hypothetical protein ACHAXA_010866 [Cyclostephanos tholiformis]|uniref:Homospermidine synthase n=1 Tax=Cyclostephanos tholiformis TaxID=382380 RepID=A0ABD3SDJ7_9STRA